mgnify:CR=1 FL=1
MRRMTELPDPEEDRVGVFPVLCRKMSFNSAMQKSILRQIRLYGRLSAYDEIFLTFDLFDLVRHRSNADKLSCADKYPANSNMYVISLYFFMNLILTFHLQKYVNKAGRDLWFL